MHCTRCGTEGAGAFCGACGATLTRAPCPACANEMEKGTCYCTRCGARMQRPEARAGAVAGPDGSVVPGRDGTGGTAGFGAGTTALPWAVAGVLMVALLVVAAFPIFSGAGGTAATGQGGAFRGATAPGALGAAPNVDLASMTPGEAADRLYDRVARALAAEDEEEVRNFLPMALDAYELARPLNAHRLFMYSFLLRVAGDYQGSLEVALEGLEEDPGHLLNLSAAAEASRELGAEDDARDYYGRMLAIWDEELERNPDAYGGWFRLLPVVREEAETFLGQG